jgi:hypothetical protein
MNSNSNEELSDGEKLDAVSADAISVGGVASRRSMLSRTALAAAGVAAAGFLGNSRRALAVSPALTFANIPGTGDVKVLNYALALEQLESDLYAQALMRLTNGGTNALGVKISGLNLNPNQPDVQYVREFGKVEQEHKAFLTAALGSAAIAPFKYDFKMQTLSRQQVDMLVYTAESTGVAAYLGAIPYFATATYLQIAGGIQGTEARHTAIVAEILDELFQSGLPVAPLSAEFGGTNNGIDAGLPPNSVLAAVSPFIVT